MFNGPLEQGEKAWQLASSLLFYSSGSINSHAECILPSGALATLVLFQQLQQLKHVKDFFLAIPQPPVSPKAFDQSQISSLSVGSGSNLLLLSPEAWPVCLAHIYCLCAYSPLASPDS